MSTRSYLDKKDNRPIIDNSSLLADEVNALQAYILTFLKERTFSTSVTKMPLLLNKKTLTAYLQAHSGGEGSFEVTEESQLVRVKVWAGGLGPDNMDTLAVFASLFSLLCRYVAGEREVEVSDEEKADNPYYLAWFSNVLIAGGDKDLELRLAYQGERLGNLSDQKSAKAKKKTSTWREKAEQNLKAKLKKEASASATASASASDSTASDPIPF